jgi:hypothetical protein
LPLFLKKEEERNFTFSISYFMGYNLPLFRTHNIYPTYLLLMEKITIVIKLKNAQKKKSLNETIDKKQ